MALSTSSNGCAMIKCRDLVVQYNLSSGSYSTLKEYTLAFLKGKRKSETFTALNSVCVEICEGECVAFLGHNGSGKSTLLKVIAGILTPKSGEVNVHGSLAPLIELGAGFDPELTGRENTYLSCGLLGLTRAQVDLIVDSINEFAELGDFFEEPVKTYSSGMYMRLGFSCAMAVNADIILIDEILAVGDENFQKKCTAKLNEIRRSGATIILVSHNLEAVKQMADRVLVLDHGKVIFDGKPLSAIQCYLGIMNEARLAALSADMRAEEVRKAHLAENYQDFQAAAGKKAVIEQVEFEQDGVSAFRITAGQPWSIRITIRVFEDMDMPLSVGFAVNGLDGARILGGNNKIYESKIPDLAMSKPQKRGRYQLCYQFRDLPIASGEYAVIAAIHDWDLVRTFDINMEALKIHVDCASDRPNFDRDIIPSLEYIENIRNVNLN